MTNTCQPSYRLARPFYLTTDEGRRYWFNRVGARIRDHGDRKNGLTQMRTALAKLYDRAVHADRLLQRRARYHKRQEKILAMYAREGTLHNADAKRIIAFTPSK